MSSRGCLPSVSVSRSKVSSSCENSSCIRFRVPSNSVGPHFFLKIFFFFNVDHYFKSVLNLFQYFFWCFGCGIFAPQLGMQPSASALEGEASMTGPPGKSPVWPRLNLLHRQRHYFQIRSHSEVLGHMNFRGILFNPVYGCIV